MAPAKTVMEGRSAAAFYMVANGVVFLLLLWYQAPIFRVGTVADALQLAAVLSWYGATIAMYLRLQTSDPGFLPQGTAFTATAAEATTDTSVHITINSPRRPESHHGAEAGPPAVAAELLPPPTRAEDEAEDAELKREEEKRDQSMATYNAAPYRPKKRRPVSEQLVPGPNGEQYRYCRVCRIWIPLRARHCKQCSRCISRYDHHCFWVGTCIGDGNHRAFLRFLLSQSGIFLLALYQVYGSFEYRETWGTWLGRHWPLLGCFQLCLGFFFLTSGLLGYQLFLISVNLTSWEHGRSGDVAYLAAVDEDSLPFDRGCPRNFAEFWRSPPRSEYTFAYNADGSLPRHRFRCCFD